MEGEPFWFLRCNNLGQTSRRNGPRPAEQAWQPAGLQTHVLLASPGVASCRDLSKFLGTPSCPVEIGAGITNLSHGGRITSTSKDTGSFWPFSAIGAETPAIGLCLDSLSAADLLQKFEQAERRINAAEPDTNHG